MSKEKDNTNSSNEVESNDVVSKNNNCKQEMKIPSLDTMAKKIMEPPENIACLLNAIFFNGSKIISPKDVCRILETSILPNNKSQVRDVVVNVTDKNEKCKVVEDDTVSGKCFRLEIDKNKLVGKNNKTNSSKNKKDKVSLDVIAFTVGIENQSKKNKNMILRTIAYDGMNYKEIYDNKGEPHWCITLVFDYSDSDWSDCDKLSKIIKNDFLPPVLVDNFCNDYKLNVINVQKDFAITNNKDGTTSLLQKLEGDIKLYMGVASLGKGENKLKDMFNYVIESGFDGNYDLITNWMAAVTQSKDPFELYEEIKKTEEKGEKVNMNTYDKYVQDKIDVVVAEKDAEKYEIIAEKDAEKEKELAELLKKFIKAGTNTDEQLKQLFKISDEKFNKIKAEL